MTIPRPIKFKVERYIGGLSQFKKIDNPIKLSANESALGPSPKAIRAFENDKDLFDDALKNKVLIVSAVSLLALLKSVHYGWMQVQLDENTQKIADTGRSLYDRFSKFYLMFEDIGKKLNTTQTSYNKAVKSMNSRLIPSMKKLKDMGAGSEDIAESELLDIQEDITKSEKVEA